MNSKIKNTKLFNLPYSKNADELEHQRQHAVWDRRSFFKALGLAGAGSMMLGKMQVSASPLSPLAAALSTAQNERILVIVRLKGGNDGLNTIIPVNQYSTYSDLRPSLKIPLANTFSLSADYAMPNFMNSLQPFWNEGKMKVIHGVGYQDQNLSHFRSADIWASGTDEDEVLTSGMMGRHYASQYPDFLTNPPAEPLAIQIGSVGNLLFTGEDNTNYAFSVADPQQLYNIAQNGWLHDMNNLPECLYGEQLGFLRGITNSTFIYAGVINDAYTSGTNSASYDTTTLSKQFAMVARLIKGGLGTKVYLITLDGFDTHADQPDAHQALLTDLDFAGNMLFDIDYRQPYVTVLEQWLCIDGQAVDNALLGVHHQRLQLGLECISSVSEQTRHEFIHKPLYMPDGEVMIEFILESPNHVQIQLMNIMGQQVAELSNRFMPTGTHRVAIRANAGHLASGQYIYRIITGNEAHSRSVILTR